MDLVAAVATAVLVSVIVLFCVVLCRVVNANDSVRCMSVWFLWLFNV